MPQWKDAVADAAPAWASDETLEGVLISKPAPTQRGRGYIQINSESGPILKPCPAQLFDYLNPIALNTIVKIECLGKLKRGRFEQWKFRVYTQDIQG